MKEQVKPKGNSAPITSYKNVVLSFIKGTIADPSFFDLSPEKQKQAATECLQKHKQ